MNANKRIAHIEDIADVETNAADVERSKPHPDIFGAALKKLGDLDPSDAIVIGDTPYDAEAASKLGLRTIGVLCGGFAEKRPSGRRLYRHLPGPRRSPGPLRLVSPGRQGLTREQTFLLSQSEGAPAFWRELFSRSHHR